MIDADAKEWVPEWQCPYCRAWNELPTPLPEYPTCTACRLSVQEQ